LDSASTHNHRHVVIVASENTQRLSALALHAHVPQEYPHY